MTPHADLSCGAAQEVFHLIIYMFAGIQLADKTVQKQREKMFKLKQVNEWVGKMC